MTRGAIRSIFLSPLQNYTHTHWLQCWPCQTFLTHEKKELRSWSKDMMHTVDLANWHLTNYFSLLLSTSIYFFIHRLFMKLAFTYHQRKTHLKTKRLKAAMHPSISQIWSKRIQHGFAAVADGLEPSRTKAPFWKGTLKCWESGHLVVTLHFFHCVRWLQATALASSYWSGSSDLNLRSLISPVLSSPT